MKTEHQTAMEVAAMAHRATCLELAEVKRRYDQLVKTNADREARLLSQVRCLKITGGDYSACSRKHAHAD